LSRPSTDFFLRRRPFFVIAGLDPAIHAMTTQQRLRGDFTGRLLQQPQFF
jgi:hypothetical protein